MSNSDSNGGRAGHDPSYGHDRSYGLSLPVLLTALGISTLYLAAQLPEFVQRGQQLPGPRYFPTILGVFFCIAGVVELVRYIRHKRHARAAGRLPADPFFVRLKSVTGDWGAHSVAIILGSLAVFVPVVQVLGFVLGGTLFSTVLMLRLKARWYNAIILSLVVVLVIAVVFGRLFRVPLPAGILGIRL